MKPIQIFTPGTHTAASGDTIEFTPEILQEMVSTYNPALHEAPVVIGHPTGDAPAYGWAKALRLDEAGGIVAELDQVHEEFEGMVESGRFKKRSASWYPPDAPNNPTPGKWHLRHIGFLGAQPPAVKGLKPVEFAEDKAHTIEFAEPGASAWHVATFFRRMREFLLDKFDADTADRVVPSYLAESAEDNARAPAKTEGDLAYQEPGSTGANPPGETDMTPEQITAMQNENARLKAENTTLTGQVTELSATKTQLEGRVASFAENESKTTVTAAVEKLIKDGKLLPAQRQATIDFALNLNDDAKSFDFGEGDKATKITLRAKYLAQLDAGPKLVNFGEHSGDDRTQVADGGDGKDVDPKKFAAKIREIQSKEPALSYEEAGARALSELTTAA